MTLNLLERIRAIVDMGDCPEFANEALGEAAAEIQRLRHYSEPEVPAKVSVALSVLQLTGNDDLCDAAKDVLTKYLTK